MLFDMHCHLDFHPDPAIFAASLDEAGCAAFSCSVTPEGYRRAQEVLAPYPAAAVGVGLHPWYVERGAKGRAQREAFVQAASETRFIGEVGLDLSANRKATEHEQIEAFEAVVDAIAHPAPGEGKLVSIHAVHAAAKVLDLLEEGDAFEGNAIVFHWFSGTSDDLMRATLLGAYFSVGPRMLKTGRGRAYARGLPVSRLLLETDLPSAPDMPLSVAQWRETLEATAKEVSELKANPHLPKEDIPGIVEVTSRQLLGLDAG